MPESTCSKISSLLVLPPIVWNTIWKSCGRENRKDIRYVSQIYGDSSLKPCYMKRYNSSTFLFKFEYLVNIAVRADSKSKNSWDSKGPLEVILSNSPAQAGSARAGCPKPWAFEYLHRWGLHSFSGQHMPGFDHCYGKGVFCLFVCFSDRCLKHVPWQYHSLC